jgi:hypothetical protein
MEVNEAPVNSGVKWGYYNISNGKRVTLKVGNSVMYTLPEGEMEYTGEISNILSQQKGEGMKTFFFRIIRDTGEEDMVPSNLITEVKAMGGRRRCSKRRHHKSKKNQRKSKKSQRKNQ